MQWMKNIAALLMSVIFLATSSGIVIYQSHCNCTGNEQVSIYVTPDTCEDELENHSHHSHSSLPEEATCAHGECEIPSDNCGCETFEISYIKLDDQVVQEKSRIKTIEPVYAELPVQLNKLLVSLSCKSDEIPEKYKSLPPISIKNTDYLVFIQQLKIPASA
jgi:hypothetical protein